MYLEDMRKGAESYFKSMQSARIKRQEELEEQRKNAERAHALLADSSSGQPTVNPDGTIKEDDKNWFQKAGITIGSMLQQAGASALDASVQALAVVEGVAIEANPFNSLEEKAEKGMASQRGVNAIRDRISSWRDLSGEQMNTRWTDDIADRVSRGQGSLRDVGALYGRGVSDAATLASPINPTVGGARAAGGLAVRATSRQIISNAAKQGVAFGGVDATAEALSSYGRGESGADALKSGAIAGAASFGFQFGLEGIGGAVANRLARSRAGDDAAPTTSSPDTETQTPHTSTEAELRTAERNRRVNEQLDERLIQIEQELSSLREGTDPSVVKLVASDGTDVTAVAQRYDQQVRELESQISDLQQQAEGMDASGRSNIPEGVDPSEYTGDIEMRAKAAEQIPKLRQQIEDLRAEQAEKFEMLGGVSEEIDTTAARAKFQDLKREKRTAIDWKIRSGGGETVESITEKIDALDDGVVPEGVVTPRPPASSVEEAFRRASSSDADDVSSVQRATVINDVHKVAIEQKLESLWTPQRHQAFLDELDTNYKLAEQHIREYPGPRQAEELEQLNMDYQAQRMESEARVAEDADEVQAALEAQRIAEDIDARIIEQWNSVERTDPTAFGDVDEDALAQIRRSLEVKRTEQKMREGQPVTETEKENAVQTAIEHAEDTAEAGDIIDASPELSDASQSIAADQVGAGKFKGSGWDYLWYTPRSSFKKLDGGEKMLEVLDDAQLKIAKDNGNLLERMERFRWGQLWRNDEIRQQSVEWLDKGTDIKKVRGESDRAFQARQEALNDVRDWFNTTGKAIGLDESTMLNNYFPHMFERTYGTKAEKVAEAMLRLRENKNANGNPLTEKQRNNLIKSLKGIDHQAREAIDRARIYKIGKNGALEKRRGAEGWTDDMPFVISEYHRMAMRQVHMEPAIQRVNQMTVGLEKKQQAYIDDFVKTWKGEPSRLDELLPGGDRTRATLSTTRRLSNLALMGLSARTVALQVFGAANNFIDSDGFGGEFLASAMRAFVSTKRPSFMGGGISDLRSDFISYGGLDGSFSGSLRSGRGLSGKLNKTERAMFGGITFVDEQLRMQAFDMGRREYAKSIGKDWGSLTAKELDAANKAGVVRANETQFSMTPLDIPLAQNSEVGKMVFQLQQFNMKQLGYNVGVLRGEKGIYNPKTGEFTMKGAERAAKMIISYAALYTLFTQVAIPGQEDSKNFFGFDWDDVLPFGEQTTFALDKLGSVVGLTEGDSEMQGVVPPLFSVVFGRGGADKGLVGNIKEYGEEDNDPMATTGKIAKSLFRNFAPGGTQAVRTAEGHQAVSRGESMNSAGSTRFLIDNDSGWNIIKGLVAGQYATKEGREWLENGMNTISKRQTVQLPDGTKMPVSEYVRTFVENPEDKAQWIGYYSAKQNADKELAKVGRKTDDVVRDIRLRLTAGRISQAEANIEIERHNQLLRDLYRPYFDGNNRAPKYVTFDFLENVMVGEATPMNFQDPSDESALLEEYM